MSQSCSSPSPDLGGRFPETRWSVIRNAKLGDEASIAEAFSSLCESYWFPVYAFVRDRGYAHHDAEDLVQGFFQYMLVEGRLVRVHESKGKFRSFVLASARNYLANDRSRRNAQKRGGGAEILSIDVEHAAERYANEPSTVEDPSMLYEKRWAETLLGKVKGRMRAEAARRGKMERFDCLFDFLPHQGRGAPYTSVSNELGIPEGAVRVEVHRMRERFRNVVRSEIAEMVDGPEELEDEMGCFLEFLGGAWASQPGTL